MGVFKKGNRYYAEYYVNGKKVRESSKTNNRAIAEKLYEKRKTEIAEGRFLDKQKEYNITLFKLIDEYVKIHLKDVSKSTQKKYLVCIGKLKKYFRDVKVVGINSRLLEGYRKARLEMGNKKATVNRDVAVLRNMLNKAVEWEELNINPIAGVKQYREIPSKIMHFTDDEIEKLLNVSGERLKPIILTALHTGIRRAQLLSLKWSNINFENRTIYIENGKWGRWQEIPINDTLYNVLFEMKQKSTGEYIFTKDNGEPCGDIKKSFNTILRKAGLKDTGKTFHTLRHTFASRLVMAGVDLPTIKELMGHSSINTTMRYAHVDQQHKREAIDKLESKMDTSMDTSRVFGRKSIAGERHKSITVQ